MTKRILWLRDWFDKNIDFYLSQLQNRENIKEKKDLLWGFLQYAQTSAYSKGRQSGIDYTIKKYINKESKQ